LRMARFTFNTAHSSRRRYRLIPTCSLPIATIPTIPESCSGLLNSAGTAIQI
jgi:hypothetical protein